jgi:hypothetical protein
MLKIRLEKRTTEIIEAESPIYAFVQKGEEEIFVRIDEEKFQKIEIFLTGEISIFTCHSNGFVNERWYLYRSTKEGWEMALKKAKNYINNFNK